MKPIILPSLLINFALSARNEPIIETTHGKIRGSTVTAVRSSLGSNNRHLTLQTEKFLGVPFAKAPIGKLRFAAPESAEKWSGVKDAKEYGYSCPMVPDTTFVKNGVNFPDAAMWNSQNMDEDCLNLNIWRPSNTKRNSKLPIVVWIYGGAFYSGSNSLDV